MVGSTILEMGHFSFKFLNARYEILLFVKLFHKIKVFLKRLLPYVNSEHVGDKIVHATRAIIARDSDNSNYYKGFSNSLKHLQHYNTYYYKGFGDSGFLKQNITFGN